MKVEERLSLDKFSYSHPVFIDYISQIEERVKAEEFLRNLKSDYGISIYKSKEENSMSDSVAVEFIGWAVKEEISYDLTWYNPGERTIIKEKGNEYEYNHVNEKEKEYKVDWVYYSNRTLNDLPSIKDSEYFDSLEEAQDEIKKWMPNIGMQETYIYKKEEDAEEEYSEYKFIGAWVKDNLEFFVTRYKQDEMGLAFYIIQVFSFWNNFQKSQSIKEVKIFRETESYSQKLPHIYSSKFKEIRPAKVQGFYTVVFEKAEPRLISLDKKEIYLKDISSLENKFIKYCIDDEGKIAQIFTNWNS